MIAATDALERWERTFAQDDAKPLPEMFSDDFVIIDSDGIKRHLLKNWDRSLT